MAVNRHKIRDAITDAADLAVTAAEMVQLLDRAIAGAIADGLPTVSYSVGGRSRQLGVREAQEMRRYYASLGDGGGIVVQTAEFL